MAAPDPLEYVQGLRQWLRLLQGLPLEVRKEIITDLATAVEPIVAGARALAPRSSRDKKGAHLADAIAVVLRSAKGILVGSRAPYGAIVHFGKQATQRSRGGTVYTRALTPTRWLYPAIAEHQAEVTARLGPAIERAIERSMSAVGF